MLRHQSSIVGGRNSIELAPKIALVNPYLTPYIRGSHDFNLKQSGYIVGVERPTDVFGWVTVTPALEYGKFTDYDVVVNLQGDFPTIRPETLRAVLAPLEDPSVDIGTLVCPIADEVEARTDSFVKCACAFTGDAMVAPALYFSRLPIPWGDGPRWHHIGVYAYRRAALDRFVTLPASPLELREKLEQLRALEAGMKISAARVEHGPFGVDTPEDLERARALLAP